MITDRKRSRNVIMQCISFYYQAIKDNQNYIQELGELIDKHPEVITFYWERRLEKAYDKQDEMMGKLAKLRKGIE